MYTIFQSLIFAIRELLDFATTTKADKPVALISGSNWNLECWFLWREENRRTRRQTLEVGTRTNKKLNPHVTLGPGIDTRPQPWKESALTAAPFQHPRKTKHLFNGAVVQCVLPESYFPGSTPSVRVLKSLSSSFLELKKKLNATERLLAKLHPSNLVNIIIYLVFWNKLLICYRIPIQTL